MVGASDAVDREITRLLRTHPPQGLRLLLQEYGGRIRGYVRQRFPSLDDGELQDVVTDAMLAVAGSFDPDRGTLSAWFLLLAHQQAVVRIRTRHARRVHERPTEMWEPTAPGVDPLSQVIARESLAELQAAITRLPRLERAVMEADLAAGEAVPAASLAASLHTTEGSIYAARRRARTRLAQQCRWIREKLKDEPEEHE